METFENRFKLKFEEMLKKFLDNEIVVSNDISHDALKKDADSIVAVIKTGLGQASSRNDYDLITTTFTVNFILEKNNLQKLLGAMTSLIWNYTGEWDTLTIPIWNLKTNSLQEKPYIFKPVFTTPVPFGGTTELASKNGTIDVTTAMCNITVAYSSNADLKPDDFKLLVDGVEYSIKPIRYSLSTAPEYHSTLLYGDQFSSDSLLSQNIVFTFVLLKALPGLDGLQTLLAGQFLRNTFLSDATSIKLKRGNDTVDISKYMIEESYEVGAKNIVLTLIR